MTLSGVIRVVTIIAGAVVLNGCGVAGGGAKVAANPRIEAKPPAAGTGGLAAAAVAPPKSAGADTLSTSSHSTTLMVFHGHVCFAPTLGTGHAVPGLQFLVSTGHKAVLSASCGPPQVTTMSPAERAKLADEISRLRALAPQASQ
jgi:hypothetical protein